MVSVLPFRLLGETDRKQLTAQLEKRLAGWIEAWFAASPVPIAPIELGADVSQPVDDVAGWWQSGAGPDAWVAMADDAEIDNTLGRLMLPGLTDGGVRTSTLMTELIDTCRQDLLGRLRGASEIKPVRVDAMGDLRTGDGSACVFFRLPRPLPSVWIACGGDVVAAMLGKTGEPGAQATTRLSSRMAAIGGGRIGLEVKLGEAVLSLGDLAHLAPGDVIVLDTEISRQLQVLGQGGALVAHGRLGRNGMHKAIQIEMK